MSSRYVALWKVWNIIVNVLEAWEATQKNCFPARDTESIPEMRNPLIAATLSMAFAFLRPPALPSSNSSQAERSLRG